MELKLIRFINEHSNWEELLSSGPYNIKITKDDNYIMFKYNQLASDFSNEIVRECRGIILREHDFKPVCVPFFKFGNYGEAYCPDIDWSSASVQQKVDGSLIKVWYDDGEWHVSTNGTIDAFKSELPDIKFASFGDLFLHELNCKDVKDVSNFFDEHLDEAFTYMFELITPYNRVVVPADNYNSSIYLLGARNNDTLEEDTLVGSDLAINIFSMPKRYNLHSLTDVQKAASELPWDEEGYVVCDKYFNRVKIKSPAYVHAHYARNNNTITKEYLLEVLLNNEQDEFLIYASDYKEEFYSIKREYLETIESINRAIGAYNRADYDTQKDFALRVQKLPRWLHQFIFKQTVVDAYLNDMPAKKWCKIMEERRGT